MEYVNIGTSYILKKPFNLPHSTQVAGGDILLLSFTSWQTQLTKPPPNHNLPPHDS
jgi:hypothetical protein